MRSHAWACEWRDILTVHPTRVHGSRHHDIESLLCLLSFKAVVLSRLSQNLDQCFLLNNKISPYPKSCLFEELV